MTATKRPMPAEGGRYYRAAGDKLTKTPPKEAEKPAAKSEQKGK